MLYEVITPKEAEEILKTVPRKPASTTGAITLVKPIGLFHFLSLVGIFTSVCNLYLLDFYVPVGSKR